MAKTKAQLIVALDVSSLAETGELLDKLSPAVDIYKIGSQLFTACGPTAVRFILARGKKVFLDLKYHDIPNTVASAVKELAGLGVNVPAAGVSKDIGQKQSVFMFTMHTAGGKNMLKTATDALKQKCDELKVTRPLAVGVTVLTSEEKKDSIQSLVLERAQLAKESGLDGVVASVEEAASIRKEFGEDFLIVTPGIRSEGADAGDQKRIATPKVAVESGSNFLVVGRPIIEAQDPLAAAQKILQDIS